MEIFLTKHGQKIHITTSNNILLQSNIRLQSITEENACTFYFFIPSARIVNVKLPNYLKCYRGGK